MCFVLMVKLHFALLKHRLATNLHFKTLASESDPEGGILRFVGCSGPFFATKAQDGHLHGGMFPVWH